MPVRKHRGALRRKRRCMNEGRDLYARRLPKLRQTAGECRWGTVPRLPRNGGGKGAIFKKRTHRAAAPQACEPHHAGHADHGVRAGRGVSRPLHRRHGAL